MKLPGPEFGLKGGFLLRWGEIKQVCEEIHDQIVGGQIQKVRQPDPLTLVLSVRSPGQTTRLVLSVKARVVRISVAESSVATLPAPTALGAWVKASGAGRRITRLTLHPTDRIVEVGLAQGRLVAELTGPSANLYGVDLADRLVTAARGIPSGRQLAIDSPYAAPSVGLEHLDNTSRYETVQQIERVAQQYLADDQQTKQEVERRRLLKRAQAKLRRLQQNIDRDAQRCTHAEDWQRKGELLKGQLYRFVRGQKTIEVQDWYADGLPMVTLTVDPRLDGPSNVERFFKQYRRARDGRSRVIERRRTVAQLRERLEDFEANLFPLVELEHQLLKLGLIKKMAAPKSRSGTKPRRPYRRFNSGYGDTILVGRGGADNHETTFRHSRGNDYWLHVRDAPGAHVIVLRPKRGGDPHQESLQDAAALAVHYSRLRGEHAVDVTITQRKNVRAIKGGAPGRVTISAAKTIVPLDVEGRVSRLFSSADDFE